MADILISKFTTQIPRVGATPATPGFAESEGQDPVAPSGTPQVYTPVTIGSPANGLSISGTQVLTIGLASTSATGALSSTDWNTFNGKENAITAGTTAQYWRGDKTFQDFATAVRASVLTGYTVGANTALAATDTILQAFGKVQGQINARISGTIASAQVAVGNGVNSVSGSSNLTFTGQILIQDHPTDSRYILRVNGTNIGQFQALSDRFRFSSIGSTSLVFATAGTDWWTVNTGGYLVSSDPNIRLGIGTINPTNTLDVNGTARIRTISNLGSAATSVLVPSATGVISLRTATEFLADAGGISGTIASGQVAFGTGVNTVGGENTLWWDSTNDRLGIGTSSPISKLEIIHSSTANAFTVINTTALGVSSGGGAAVRSNTHPTTTGQRVGGFLFGSVQSAVEYSPIAIFGYSAGLWDNTSRAGYFAFETTPSGSNTRQERLRITESGQIWIGTTSGTNTLDVNGTARIRTISNLGSAATSVLVPSATGVVSLRTLAELASDMGTSFDSRYLRKNANDTSSVRYIFNPSIVSGEIAIQINPTHTAGSSLWVGSSGVRKFAVQTSNIVAENLSGNAFTISASIESGERCFRIEATNAGLSGSYLQFSNPDQGINVRIDKNGIINASGLSLNLLSTGGNIVLGTTGGTRIGTATNQLLAFYGSTPIVKPSGDILTALSNLGLVASPTITQVDQFAVKTTASADQTLPSGTLTILDYDSTLLNNSTATYTVGTNGRITINTTGIYTITAGVVIEADAVTALESAFLGIFRNGDLVAISSINTTIAAGAQSGLSTSTILSLTATDIIDCRALVNSVGGVANGLARRLGTLLGANATQVNSLSITKNSM